MEKTLDSDIAEIMKSLNGNTHTVMHSIELQITAFEQTPVFSSLSQEQKSKSNDIIMLTGDPDFNPATAVGWYEEFRTSLSVEHSLRPFRDLVAEAIKRSSYGGRQI